MLNLELMKNPINWFIIVLMITIAAIAADIILGLFSAPSQTEE